MKKTFSTLALLAMHSVSGAQGVPPLEAYGALPEETLMTISPGGHLVAYRSTNNDQDVVVLIDIDEMRLVTSVNVEQVKPRSLQFVDDENLLILTSNTVRSFNVRGPWEASAAWLVGTSGDEFRKLLDKAKELYPYQSGLGRVVGANTERNEIYMPAFLDTGGKTPPLGLFRVSSERSSAYRVSRGRSVTIDWFVDSNGDPLIREDFDNKKNLHRIYLVNENPNRLLYERETNRRILNVIGLMPDYRALVVSMTIADVGYRQLFTMSLEDGTLSGPIFDGKDRGIESVVIDVNRVVHGVEYEGFFPRYSFTIPALITAKPELIARGKAPLIVMPHGGPASYDKVSFDWLAQYFASRDYVVFQPQFRGSTGFGSEFKAAGHGEYGRKMQTDLDDGVKYLVDRGIADADRVCIIGGSYGGYAALAAGAFAPELYSCHVSINGLADIRRLLANRSREHGRSHLISMGLLSGESRKTDFYAKNPAAETGKQHA